MTKLIKANRVCEMCGGISQMTLWRWLNDGNLSFPRPIYITRYRYWYEKAIADWVENRVDTVS